MLSRFNMIGKSKQIRKSSYSNIPKLSFDYISDVHVDKCSNSNIPIITNKQSNYLLLPGDVGFVQHPNFELFLSYVSKLYELVFFVPGNHEYNTSLWKYQDIQLYSLIMKNICNNYKNIILLEGNNFLLNDIAIIGTTLWSYLTLDKLSNYDHDKYSDKYFVHNCEFMRQVDWLIDEISKYSKVIVLTHYLPSKLLISDKYLNHPYLNGWYSDLDYLLKPPVNAWICGHSHATISKNINSVYCGLNAVGYQENKQLTVQTFHLE